MSLHPLYAENKKTLLGRLKNGFFQRISGSIEILPSRRDVFREIFRIWKQNPTAGRLTYFALAQNSIESAVFPAKLKRHEACQVLDRLNQSEVFSEIYCEGRLHGCEGTPYRGCLILGHRQPSDKPGYYAAVFGEDGLGRCQYFSIAPAAADGQGRFSVLQLNGWVEFDVNDASRYDGVRVVIATLKNHLNLNETRRMRVDSLPSASRFVGPDDPELMSRILAVHSGEMNATKAIVDITVIKPLSVEFCLTFSKEFVEGSAKRMRNGFRPEILVYWCGESFVSSDDYLYYIAYKSVGCKDVPVVILGDFPSDFSAIKTGGCELFPPIGIGYRSRSSADFSKEFKEWKLEEEFSPIHRREIPGRSIATWMTFADVLDDDRSDERKIHNFLIQCPDLLNVYGSQFSSEVRLGDKYKIDIVVRSPGVRDHVMLVELENHKHRIFTKGKQFTSGITHAIQQVQDWFRWIRENPDHAFSKSIGGLPPAGMVVAGRSIDFDDEDRARLAHLNALSPVPVITYDELLEGFGDYILRQID